jgi:hypothetical protein
MHGEVGPAIGGLFFILLWLLMMAGGLIGYIVLLVAFWRLMRAHESLAESLKDVARKLESRER